MKRSAFMGFGLAFLAVSILVMGTGLVLAVWISEGTGFARTLLVCAVFAVIGSGLLSGAAILLWRRLIPAGMIDREAARHFVKSLEAAAGGDMEEPLEDLALRINGEDRVIPFRSVYDRLVSVMVEADRMSRQLKGLGQELLGQAVQLSESADDQRASVNESTGAVSRIHGSIGEVQTNLHDLAGLGDNISSSAYQLMASIEEVNRTVQTLNQAVREVVSAFQQITGNIHAVAESAESLSSSALQSQRSMEQIDRATRSIRDRAESAAELAAAVREETGQGQGLLASTVAKLRSLTDSVEDSRKIMKLLGVQSQSIGEIVNVISQVTADTHLLSLNASIMAAKAGEHGRGFAVVAQEIKTLAQRTAQSAKEIESLILETQESVARAVRAIEEGAARAQDSMSLSEQADQALAKALKRVDVSADNSRQIAKDTEAQAAMSEQITTAVDEVAKRAELIRAAMREQEDSIKFVEERSIKMREHMGDVAQAMSEQATAGSRISEAMEKLTARIQGIQSAANDQAKSSEGIVHATRVIRKKADLVAISAQNVNNTSMSVLHNSLLLHHELKGMKLPEQTERITIGVAFANLREERWRREKEIFDQKARELGLAVKFTVAEGNPRRQKEQVLELLEHQIRLLITVAVDAEEAADYVKKVKAAGVPVIAYDRLIKNAPLDLFVSFNAMHIGKIQAQDALEKARGKRFLVLAGSAKDVNAQFLHRGQMKILAPLVERGQIELAGEVWTPDWDPEQAYQITQRTIQEKGALDAVIASNDGTAGGAVRAIKELLPDRKVVVTGMDTELAACRRLLEGTQTMTVYMPIKLQAVRTLEAALLMLKDEEIPGITDFVDNGAGRVPAILLRPVKIDADNLEEVVVRAGYHSREDIFG